MGKFFEAFKKFEEEDSRYGVQPKLCKQDWYALLQHNRKSGFLDLSNPDLIEGEGTFERLLNMRMIDADGRLTPEGIQACETFLQAVADAAEPGEGGASKRSSRNSTEDKIIPSDISLSDPKEVLITGGTPKIIKPTTTDGDSGGGEYGRVGKESSVGKGFHKPRGKSIEEISQLAETRGIGELKISAPNSERIASSVYARRTEADQPFQFNGQANEVDAGLVVLRQPYSPEAEQFKALRSSILYPGSGKGPRVILVTSTQPGEGKSFVAANLAASIALHLDRYVLLIDCDLRNPTLHLLFGRQDGPGLSEHLEGRLELALLLKKTQLPRLSLLTSGKKPYNPSELLTSEKMSNFLEEVKNRYEDRVIVMDSPPLMAAAESNVLAGFAEGILLVVREGGPKREAVLEAVQKIDKRKILGLVGNFSSKRTSGYYYNSKKYRGY